MGIQNSLLDSLLYVCQNSRITYLKRYTAWGKYSYKVDDQRAVRTFSYFYVNFNKDELDMILHNCNSHRTKSYIAAVLLVKQPFVTWIYSSASSPACPQPVYKRQWCRSLEEGGAARVLRAKFRVVRGEDTTGASARKEVKRVDRRHNGNRLTEAELLADVMAEKIPEH